MGASKGDTRGLDYGPGSDSGCRVQGVGFRDLGVGFGV